MSTQDRSLARFLNLGCGGRYVRGWTNLDFYSNADVTFHDLREPLPFASQTFDVVYHSHVLEHFSRADGQAFMGECFRVLKPGGTLRVAVPDLEGIIRGYLSELKSARDGSDSAAINHEWMIIELFDQMVRTVPGGEMATFLKSPQLANEQFVVARLGTEARRIIERSRQANPQTQLPYRVSLRTRLRTLVRSLDPRSLRLRVAGWLLGRDVRLLELARFLETGENHRWMYDQVTLTRLLEASGFAEVCRVSAAESRVDSWSDFHLDTETDGSVYKPDSLFMEATKPVRSQVLADSKAAGSLAATQL